MDRPVLSVTLRPAIGTRAVTRLRREGFIPGVVYGKAKEPTPVMVNRRELARLYAHRTSESALITLKIDGSAATAADAKKAAPKGKAASGEYPALIKELQHDPVNGDAVHVDFQTIALTEKIRIKVPLALKGDPVGVKQDGGILEHFLREIEVECLPTNIPEAIEHEVSQMGLGQNLHARDLVMPHDVRLMTDPDAVVIAVLAPKVEKPEEAVEGAPTEPEVIRERKPDAEEGEAAAEGKDAKEQPAAKEGGKEKK